jgi:hypothetical protein
VLLLLLVVAATAAAAVVVAVVVVAVVVKVAPCTLDSQPQTSPTSIARKRPAPWPSVLRVLPFSDGGRLHLAALGRATVA